PPPPAPAPLIGRRWPQATRPAYGEQPVLRVVPGPHLDCLPADSVQRIHATTFRINQTSNRMGYRLDGLQLAHVRPCSLPSLGVIPGVIQIPPDGTPILLMADAQTTGGYPVAGVVIGADIPLAAQLLPGDRLHMRFITPAEGRAALAELQTYLFTGPEPADEGDPLMALAGAPAIFPESQA
ncbi:MAG: hypothetical protein HC822_26595, partial [Oscillochloris sp.]|nr:hypothetical protein [Oscillochloris sp.]